MHWAWVFFISCSIPIYLSIYLSVYLPTYLSSLLSISVSITISYIHIFICICIFVSSICISVYIIYISKCLSTKPVQIYIVIYKCLLFWWIFNSSSDGAIVLCFKFTFFLILRLNVHIFLSFWFLLHIFKNHLLIFICSLSFILTYML